MEALFEFLFKYRPVVFEKGRFAFAAGPATYIVIAIALAVAVPALIAYARLRMRGGPRDRAVLLALRLAGLAIVVVALMHPILVVSEAVPQRNVVGVLVDDSRSMRIADLSGTTRADAVRHLLGTRDSSLYRALADKFVVRLFRFSGNGERVAQLGDLTYDGVRTQLGPALEAARQELTGVPLSGLVLVSDGADNSTGSLTDAVMSLGARHVPVFTVGVGRERFTKDIEVSRVEAPRNVLKGASLVVDVLVAQRGYTGDKVQMIVEDGGRIVSTQSVTLSGDGEAIPVRVRVPTTEAGARVLTFRIPPQPGEMVAQNNTQQAIVNVSDRREKILYIEGEPRSEMRFLRNAVRDDKNLQIVTLQRLAKDQFRRFSVDDSLDLVAGFPKTRDELFAYKGIILGSIEASYFTGDQLRMLADFVSERGGGLLALGGRRALGEGGFAGTPVAEVLPVDLGGGPNDKSGYFSELKVDVTVPGSMHAATQIADAESTSAKRWKTMPAVTSVNRIGRARPGATVLLTGTPTKGGERQTVLAFQRYGRGKAIAFPVQDSWLWQMLNDVDDVTFESYWRQLLRWLVSDVPSRVMVAAAGDQAAPGDAVELNAEVSDRTFLKVNNAEAVARVTSPSGNVSEMPLEWSVTRDGQYKASFTPTEKGLYRVDVRARMGTDSIVSDPSYIASGDLSTEYFGAEMRAPLLRRIADETGGRFYTGENVAQLAKDIVFTDAGNTVVDRKDLWDMPIVFLLILALVTSEWGYRKLRGLA
ncbi:MAG TPA: glutamine amidotransferase [Gemmatimonadaceae bacterium]